MSCRAWLISQSWARLTCVLVASGLTTRADRQHASRGGDHGHTEAAKRHGASPRQIVLAWLLARSPQMLPIPGTGSPGHAEANAAAAASLLTPHEVAAITAGA